MKKSLAIIGFISITACVWCVIYEIWSGGFTPNQVASVLINDADMGGRALSKAIFFKDSIFPSLRVISENYKRLNSRNSERVATLLIKNDSPTSLKLANELYSRKGNIERLVGSVGLAAHGKLPAKDFQKNGFLHEILERVAGRDQYGPNGMLIINDQDEIELALIAAKYAKSKDSVSDIVAIIQKEPLPYFEHAMASDALGKIGDVTAIPFLEASMKSKNFYALPNAFCALVLLSDNQAIPLAIDRITPDIKGRNSQDIIKKLEEVTGKHFGFSQEEWRQWLRKNKNHITSNHEPCIQDDY